MEKSVSDMKAKLEAQEKDRQALRAALIDWFADMDNVDKKRSALDAFYAFASHDPAIC
jgi:hypothetical protein